MQKVVASGKLDGRGAFDELSEQAGAVSYIDTALLIHRRLSSGVGLRQKQKASSHF